VYILFMQVLSLLPVDELKYICAEYNNDSKKKNKEQLLQEIKEIEGFEYDEFLLTQLDNLKLRELKNICRDYGVKEGTKEEMINGIKESGKIVCITWYINGREGIEKEIVVDNRTLEEIMYGEIVKEVEDKEDVNRKLYEKFSLMDDRMKSK
jgi:hypothetical protein